MGVSNELDRLGLLKRLAVEVGNERDIASMANGLLSSVGSALELDWCAVRVHFFQWPLFGWGKFPAGWAARASRAPAGVPIDYPAGTHIVPLSVAPDVAVADLVVSRAGRPLSQDETSLLGVGGCLAAQAFARAVLVELLMAVSDLVSDDDRRQEYLASYRQAQIQSIKEVLSARHPRLTRRQLEVLSLMQRGRSNLEIARELCIATKTVEFHITRIFALMNARSRTEALAKSLDIPQLMRNATKRRPG